MVGKRKRVYEGSKQDLAEDKRGVKRLKMSLEEYERTAQDKTEDKRGQQRLRKK